MGVFDLIGTTASGWLSDRYKAVVWLLFWYYGLRGYRCCSCRAFGLRVLGLCRSSRLLRSGLIATVPPTVKLATGLRRERAPLFFGWIAAGHQLGAGITAFRGRRDPQPDRQLRRRISHVGAAVADRPRV